MYKTGKEVNISTKRLYDGWGNAENMKFVYDTALKIKSTTNGMAYYVLIMEKDLLGGFGSKKDPIIVFAYDHEDHKNGLRRSAGQYCLSTLIEREKEFSYAEMYFDYIGREYPPNLGSENLEDVYKFLSKFQIPLGVKNRKRNYHHGFFGGDAEDDD